MNSYKSDFHTVCVRCRGVDCDLTIRCIECTDVASDKMSEYVTHKLSLKKKLESKYKLKALSQSLQLLSFFAFATAPLMLPTFPPSLSILLLAISLCCLHTHSLKFSILETSMYTTLTGSNPPTLMLGELRRFISLFLMSWNKLSNILHVFLIVMTMQQTLLTYSLLLTLRTILTLSPLLWDPLTIVLFQLLQLLLHHLSLLLSVIYGTLRTPGVLI